MKENWSHNWPEMFQSFGQRCRQTRHSINNFPLHEQRDNRLKAVYRPLSLIKFWIRYLPLFIELNCREKNASLLRARKPGVCAANTNVKIWYVLAGKADIGEEIQSQWRNGIRPENISAQVYREKNEEQVYKAIEWCVWVNSWRRLQLKSQSKECELMQNKKNQ